MAELWEVSAVIAMRDLQWLFAPKGVLPNAGINLAGNAESRLGDLAAHINERFFLFEIKSQASDFSSEWKMKKRGGEKPRTKHAYASVLDIVKDLNASVSITSQDSKDLIQSMRCHHFAYWHVGAPSQLHSKLCLQPYLRAVIEGSLKKHNLNKVVERIANDLSLGHSQYVNDEVKPFNFKKCQAGSVGAAHHGHLGIAIYMGNGQPYRWLPLGLPISEFQDYIDLLMSNAPNQEEQLNSVAISTQGWQRVLGSTKDLAQLLEDIKATSPSNGNDDFADSRSLGAGRSDAVFMGGDSYEALEDNSIPLYLSNTPEKKRRQ